MAWSEYNDRHPIGQFYSSAPAGDLPTLLRSPWSWRYSVDQAFHEKRSMTPSAVTLFAL
jgi:hypothetical protein